MNTSSDARNPVELLAEEFLERKRRGEQPTLSEYVERYPELADDIRDLFPALLMMEDLGEELGRDDRARWPRKTARPWASRFAAAGRLPDPPRDRPGRHGRGLRGRARVAGPAGGAQGAVGRVAARIPSRCGGSSVRRRRRRGCTTPTSCRCFGVGGMTGHHYFVMQFIAGLGLDVVLDDLRRLRREKRELGPAAIPCRTADAGLSAVDVARSLVTGQFAAEAPVADVSTTESVDAAASRATSPVSNGRPAAVHRPWSATARPSCRHRPTLTASSIAASPASASRWPMRSNMPIGRESCTAMSSRRTCLLDNHGNVWVADFGLAKTAEADDLTHTGDILGTIRYMAPERFSGQCDARSDVYSLGLTLYELVALRPAYEASDRHALIERVLHEEPDRLKKLAPGVPRDLETIVAKAMAREPAARYATAAGLAEDLRRFVEDRPIRAAESRRPSGWRGGVGGTR